LASHLDLPATALPLRADPPLDSNRANPAEVLLRALGADHLEARVVESLPWLVRTYADLDWDWVMSRAKQSDLQNRLGFVVAVARGLTEGDHDVRTTTVLRALEARLESSRLQKQDAFSRQSMTTAEERWLQEHGSPEAKHWNMLSTLSANTARP